MADTQKKKQFSLCKFIKPLMRFKKIYSWNWILCFFQSWILLGTACTTPQSLSDQTQKTDKNLPEFLNHLTVTLSDSRVSTGTALSITLEGTLPEEKLGSPPSPSSQLIAQFEENQAPFFTTLNLSGKKKYQAILGIPYYHKPGPGIIRIVLAQPEAFVSHQTLFSIPIIIEEGRYASEILNVTSTKVSPKKKKDLIRIRREQNEIVKIYKTRTFTKLWTQPFDFPIHSLITSPFGTRRVYNGTLSSYHTGLDLRAPLKTPIYATASGIVRMAKNLFYTGNTVILDHGYGILTLYAHMSQIKVQIGQIVQHQELLGLSGNTGRVNGPHLHWQVIVNQIKVNPISLLEIFKAHTHPATFETQHSSFSTGAKHSALLPLQ